MAGWNGSWLGKWLGNWLGPVAEQASQNVSTAVVQVRAVAATSRAVVASVIERVAPLGISTGTQGAAAGGASAYDRVRSRGLAALRHAHIAATATRTESRTLVTARHAVGASTTSHIGQRTNATLRGVHAAQARARIGATARSIADAKRTAQVPQRAISRTATSAAHATGGTLRTSTGVRSSVNGIRLRIIQAVQRDRATARGVTAPNRRSSGAVQTQSRPYAAGTHRTAATSRARIPANAAAQGAKSGAILARTGMDARAVIQAAKAAAIAAYLASVQTQRVDATRSWAVMAELLESLRGLESAASAHASTADASDVTRCFQTGTAISRLLRWVILNPDEAHLYVDDFVRELQAVDHEQPVHTDDIARELEHDDAERGLLVGDAVQDP